MTDFNRRIFLRGAGGTALGLVLTPLGSGCQTNEVRPKGIGRTFDFLTPIDTSLEDEPARRPSDSFFVQWGAAGIPALSWRFDDVPVLGREEWSMRIEGLVPEPVDVSFGDLQRKASEGEEVVLLNTLRCIFDSTEIPGLVGNAIWRGVPLRGLLEDAGIDRAQTARVRYFGRDGFNNNLRVDDIFLPATTDEPVDPLLVYEMNGEPVPHVHGGPVRLLTPGRYGYKNVKWIERLEVTADDGEFGSYQDQFGFFDAGTIQPVTKVTSPLTRAEVPAGEIECFGYALSGLAGVATVEASVDGAAFEPAELLPLEDIRTSFPDVDSTLQVASGAAYPYRGVWTLFRYRFTAEPGARTLRFRCSDAAGNQQPEEDRAPRDGATGYWTIQINVT